MRVRTASHFFIGTLRWWLVGSVAVINAILVMVFIAGHQTWLNGALCAGMAILMGSVMAFGIGAHFTRRLKVIQSLNATLEQRVAGRTYQLECTNKELAAFSYSVSHDLRAPLRAIDGFSGFLEEGYGEKLDEEGRRLLSIIRANTRKMDRLITDLLALSRATQNELNYTTLDMRALVEAIYDEVVPEEIRRQFKFTLGALPAVRGDAVLLRQVWVNLISNAIKYTSKSPVKEIEIGGFIKGAEVVYYIKDTGVGFNPDYAGKLFGAFQRLHKAEDFEGSGIGLAIVQRIIRRHEGQVWAEGAENAGATFSFSIPVMLSGTPS